MVFRCDIRETMCALTKHFFGRQAEAKRGREKLPCRKATEKVGTTAIPICLPRI